MVKQGWIAAVVLAVACSGTEGTSGPPSGPPSYGDSACAACVVDACSDTRDQCGSYPDCARYVDCLDGCAHSDDAPLADACVQRCTQSDSATAQQAIDALERCRTQGAGAHCKGCAQTPADDGHWILDQDCDAGTDPDICVACQEEACCETRQALRDNPEGLALRDCIVACGGITGSCEYDCSLMHPDGIVSWAAAWACVGQHCIEACDGTPTPCDTCSDTYCAAAWAETHATADNYLYLICTKTCADAACRADCAARYPEGFAATDNWLACVSFRCPEC